MCFAVAGSGAGAASRPPSGASRRRATSKISRTEFSRVYREGRRYAGEVMALYVRRTESHRRAGVTAGRGLGGAVVRNRAKRRLREAYRRIEHRLRPTGDIVFVARPGAAVAEFTEIMREMETLCAAGRLLCGPAT